MQTIDPALPARETPRASRHKVAWYADDTTRAQLDATCAATGLKRTQLISLLVDYGLKSPQFKALLDSKLP